MKNEELKESKQQNYKVTHKSKNPLSFFKSLHFDNINLHKIHIFKSPILDKIHILKISYST